MGNEQTNSTHLHLRIRLEPVGTEYTPTYAGEVHSQNAPFLIMPKSMNVIRWETSKPRPQFPVFRLYKEARSNS